MSHTYVITSVVLLSLVDEVRHQVSDHNSNPTAASFYSTSIGCPHTSWSGCIPRWDLQEQFWDLATGRLAETRSVPVNLLRIFAAFSFFSSFYPSHLQQPGCCCSAPPSSSPCGIHGEAITGIRCRVEPGLLYQPRISPHFPSALSVCVQMAHSHQAGGPTSASNLFISPQTERGLWEESLATPDPRPLGPPAGEQKRRR